MFKKFHKAIALLKLVNINFNKTIYHQASILHYFGKQCKVHQSPIPNIIITIVGFDLLAVAYINILRVSAMVS